MRDAPYYTVIGAAYTWFRLADLKIRVTGQEHIPREGGAVLAINHISYIDFILAGYGVRASKRLARFMAKREVFDHPIGGPVMRSFKHISVDRSAGLGSMDAAAKYLRKGEVVGIFPEATISRSFLIKELKTGATRIAAKAEVPLIPIVNWGTQRIFTKDHPKDFSRGKTIAISVGEPLHPTGTDPVAETAELKSRMGELLDETITRYPAEEQPPGSWWLPASYGGSAPTLEEAEAIDAAEKRERAQKRAKKARAKAAKKRG
jgi:1-acyl-sn-glycerol-3-phosphate acyltransferase